ncbi:permease prefix domain 1-containing protein [Actinoplanes sp. NPDC048796]|uniref:permease prefix domain 1-containing protein n=1 Tax=unclassified Actinoplanes TaxID=2626549 RepID=UPI0033D0E64E
MTVTNGKDELEDQFVQWRQYVRRRPELVESDADELEDHLRDSVDELVTLGLSRDEAFLVAVKRMGGLDDLSREFAREHSERLWKQLMFTGESGRSGDPAKRRDLYAMLICVAGAIVSIKVPALFGRSFTDFGVFYGANLSLFAFPWLAGFLLWRRRPAPWVYGVLVALFALGAVVANVYPPEGDSQTVGLIMTHLPAALWLVLGLAYVSDDPRSTRRRMDFIRFTGEWFVYVVLMMLGGGVLIAFLYGIFEAIGVQADPLIEDWVVPCGMVAAVVVGGWLVEVKQGVIENIAPVLTRLFTPLFTAALLGYLVVIGWNGRGIDVDRSALVMFDLLLAVVLGLLLYSQSARDPLAPRGPFDVMQLALVLSALLIDALVLYTMAGRIAEYGTTPNNVTAIGQNIVLLVNLAWSAWLLLRFVRRRGGFAAIERWQTLYLPVYAVWFWTVVLILPPVFGFR